MESNAMTVRVTVTLSPAQWSAVTLYASAGLTGASRDPYPRVFAESALRTIARELAPHTITNQPTERGTR